MRHQIAQAANFCAVAGMLVAFVGLMFVLKFAWSTSSMDAGIGVTGDGALAAILGFGAGMIAGRGVD